MDVGADQRHGEDDRGLGDDLGDLEVEPLQRVQRAAQQQRVAAQHQQREAGQEQRLMPENHRQAARSGSATAIRNSLMEATLLK